jgi:hypothetical protein
MSKAFLLISAASATLMITSPADARHRYRHHYGHRNYAYVYAPYRYYPYAYRTYAYPAYYGYRAYYGYPAYYAYPAYSYSTIGISVGFGGGYHHRHYRRHW